MDDKYICYDDGVLEKIIAIRNMSDKEFEEYLKTLKEKEEYNASDEEQK